MNSEIAFKHLENLAISGCLERLSPATRTTKAITYRTPAGRNFALEVGDTISGKFTQTSTLVLEAQPPGESPDWNGIEGISGITPVDGQFKSTAYQTKNVRLDYGKQRHVRADSIEAVDALLAFYDGGKVAFKGLTAPDILDAIKRSDEAGPVATSIGLMESPEQYWLIHDGRRYCSTALVCDALGHIGSSALPGSSEAKKILDALEFVVIDWPQFEQFRTRFQADFPDFVDFSRRSGKYWDTEREYKEKITAKVRAIAESTVDARSAGEAILRALSVDGKYLPIGWRAFSLVSAAPKELHEWFYTAVGTLARSASDASEAVAAAAQTFEQLRADGIVGLSRGMILNVAITVFGTINPQEGTWFKVSKVEEMGRRLFGQNLFAGQKYEPDDFDEYVRLMRALFELMREELGWKPTDLFDVQGFIWVALGVEAETAEPDPQTAVPSQQISRISILGKPSVTTNLILYGPPGTGKTFGTMAEAVRLSGKPVPLEPTELQAVYKALVEAGQVKFVTFHQNYAYEDFVEGLRPETGTADGVEGSVGFRLETKPGIFRDLVASAELARNSVGQGAGFDLTGRQVFKMSLGRVGVEDHIFDAAINGGYAVLGWGGDVDWSDPKYDGKSGYQAIFDRWNEIAPGTNGNAGNIVQLWRFRTSMKEGDLIVVSSGNKHFRAIGEVVGPYSFEGSETRDYNHRRAVRWLVTPTDPVPVERIYKSAFSQQSCYLLRDDQIKREVLAHLLPGDQPVENAVPEQFVLIIDEINRANISKVFGELITLLEPDKRLGGKHELTLTLPYSKTQHFGVPNNLHIVGTMNTADRSIALLDTALRRRFEFRELMPQPELLAPAAAATGINLMALLRAINSRIEYLFDREHQVGHAFFMECKTTDDVDAVMRNKVLPLLAEYFYEDWAKVAAVLSRNGNGGGFLYRTELQPPPGLLGDGDAEVRYRWQVRETFDRDAYDQLV